MIIIAGSLSIDPALADTFWDAATEMMAASRAERGCGAYTFSRDISDPAVVHLFEKWDDAASLDAHGASDHMRTFYEAAGATVVGRNLSTFHDAVEEPRP